MLELVGYTRGAFNVRVASEERLTYDVLYTDISIHVQGVIITKDLYALPLVEIDIVLGCQRLEGLEQVILDYGKGTMQFK